MRKIAITLIALVLSLALAQGTIDAEFYRDLIASEMGGAILDPCPEYVLERSNRGPGFTIEPACFTYEGSQRFGMAEIEAIEERQDSLHWDGPWEETPEHQFYWRYMETVRGDFFAIVLAGGDKRDSIGVIDFFVFDE